MGECINKKLNYLHTVVHTTSYFFESVIKWLCSTQKSLSDGVLPHCY